MNRSAPLLRTTPTQLTELVDQAARVEVGLTELAPEIWQEALWEPVRELLDRPGKSFRARLAEASFSLVERRLQPPAELGAALEILHAGSLVVDDIEDDSTERRGGPTLHRLYGVPRALNAGNFMYFWALDLLGKIPLPPEASGMLTRRALRTLLDCHRGQALDLHLAVGRTPQSAVPAAVEETTALKTGALVSLATFAGVAVAGGTAPECNAAARFGACFGTGLQQLDDLGNLRGRQEPGKRHEDLRAGRLTWPWSWAAESLPPARFNRLEAQGRALLAAVAAGDAEVDAMSATLADDLRGHAGLHRIRHIVATLSAALDELERVFGRSPVTQELAAEIARLGVSYG